MGMPELAQRWTREMVLALPDDGNRYELLDGELLVSPSPRSAHQDTVGTLYALVRAYVRAHRIGHPQISPADLQLTPEELAQPDLFVVPLVEGRRPKNWEEYGIPLLVVEVLSPSTARYDRLVKRRRYQRAGTREYWIVDPDARLVERWRPDDERPEILEETLIWHPDPAQDPLRIELPAFFHEVWGEP